MSFFTTAGKKLYKRVTSLFFLALVLFQQIVPVVSLVNLAYAQTDQVESSVQQAQSVVPVSYNQTTHEFQLSLDNVQVAEYQLTYNHGEDLQEVVQGMAQAEQSSIKATLFAGTCSGNDCTPHEVTSAKGSLKITDLAGEMKFVEAEIKITDGVSWTKVGDVWTVTTVEMAKTYVFPDQNEVSVVFTKLPAQPGSLSMRQLQLSEEQVKELGALSSAAYEITSTMADGTFAYTLQLPTTSEQSTVKYAESVADLDEARVLSQKVEVKDETVIVEAVDHFTVFVVTNTVPASTNGVCIAQATNPAANCYNTIQAAINAAAAGDTIIIANGTYNESPFITTAKDGLTIQGESQAGVIINSTNAFGFDIQEGADNITLRNFTQNYNRVATPGFGVKVYNNTGFTIENVTLNGSVSTNSRGLDLNSTTNVTISNVTITDFDRNGIGVTAQYDANDLVTSNLAFSNITLNNNAASGGWAGISFYTNGGGGGSGTITDVTFSGTNSISNGANGIVIEAAGGLLVQGAGGADLDLGTLAFSTHATSHIRNFSNSPINALSATFDGVNGVGATQPQLDAIEALLIHNCAGITFLGGACNVPESTDFGAYTGVVTYNLIAPPATPLFWVEEDTTQVELNWVTSATATSYSIYRDGGVLATGVAGTTYTDATAANGTTYTYEVRAVNAGGESVAQTAKTAQTFDVVIDDNSLAADGNASGTFSTSGAWSGYVATTPGIVGQILQNALGGDNYSVVGMGSGQTATWTTTANLNGLYNVYAQNICDSSRGQAQYTITSGGFTVGTATLNQNTTDGSTVCGAQGSVSAAGPQWVLLGQFPIVNAQASVTLTAAAGQNNILADGVAFEYVAPYGSIQGRKYNDVNGNGNFDLSEAFVPGNPNRLDGWTISLYTDLAQPAVATMVTGDDTTIAGTVGKGQYRFVGLTAGTYYVCETQQAGWVQTERTTGAANPNGDGTVCFTVNLGVGQNAVGRQFGNFQLNTIQGTKFNDLTADGFWDNGEPGLQNWEITVTGTDHLGNPVALSAVTDVNGQYTITGLDRGSYTVCETDQADWTQTYPTTNGGCYTIDVVESGYVWTDVDFGNAQEGMIQGRKFDDVNADGTRDFGDTFMNGWLISLFKFDCNCGGWNFITSMLTGDDSTPAGNVANGQYRFTGLLTGTYAVCETPQTGWVQTRPWGGLGNAILMSDVDPSVTNPNLYCFTVNLNPNQNAVGRRFGNFQLAEVYGGKFNDSNNNSTWDVGTEVGMANWSIRITGTDSNSQAVDRTILTDSNGQFALTGDQGLFAGTYQICEVQQTNWTQTAPAGSGCYAVDITQSGEVVTDLYFGNRYTPPSGGFTTPGNGGTSAPGGASAPVCTDNAPGSAPANFRVSSSGNNTVTLAWESVSPASHYGLAFTRNSDGAQYGAANIGNVTSYTINGISGGDAYSFEVFGVNGCAPGPRAKIASQRVVGRVLSTRPVGQDGTVLGMEVVELATQSAELKPVVDTSVQIAGATDTATCVEPWWRWLVPLIQLVLVSLVVLLRTKRGTRAQQTLVIGLISVVAGLIVWFFFCALLPWLYYVLAIALIGLVGREIFASLTRSKVAEFKPKLERRKKTN